MDPRLFTTPDRIIEAAAAFSAGSFERPFDEVLSDPVPTLMPARWTTERPVRAMRSACRPVTATAG